MTEPNADRDYRVGEGCRIDPGATVGYAHDEAAPPTVLGDNATVRAGTIVYRDVEVGDGFNTGHNALVREGTRAGDDVLVGTDTVLDGHVDVGSHVSMQTGVYAPPNTTIGDNAFLGPHAVLTDDPYPIRREGEDHLAGPTIERGASVGANATILPGVTVGAEAFVAAGAVVIEDVPPGTLAVGVPARIEELPDTLEGGNTIA